MDASVDSECGGEGQQQKGAVGHYADEGEGREAQQQTQHTHERHSRPTGTLPEDQLHDWNHTHVIQLTITNASATK